MKINLLSIVLLLLLAHPAPAQDLQILTVRHACAFDDRDDRNQELYTFPGSQEAQTILREVMRANVLEPNFILRSGDCKNALATTLNGQRYIIYSTTFLEKFKRDARTKWAAYCVLAHEIGHHLNNHDLNETDLRKRKGYEVQADRFAGGVLYRLGATLDEAQAGIQTFSLESGSETHPPKSARLEAVAAGWKQAQEIGRGQQQEEKVVPSGKDREEEAEGWVQKGYYEKDCNKQIEYYDKAIQLKLDYAEAYNNRGEAKDRLFQYNEAIKDFDKVIQLKPDHYIAYCNRGLAKEMLGQNKEAIKDCDKTIQLKADYTDAYTARGWLKHKLGQYNEAIQDYDKVIQLDPNNAINNCTKGCTLVKIEKYADAIDYLNKGLRLNPTITWAKDCLKEATSKL